MCPNSFRVLLLIIAMTGLREVRLSVCVLCAGLGARLCVCVCTHSLWLVVRGAHNCNASRYFPRVLSNAVTIMEVRNCVIFPLP